MKAEELRIWNFVRRRHDNEEWLDFQVTAILASVDYSFEGIPLTTEWLERFGFRVEVKKSYSLGYEKEYKVYTNGICQKCKASPITKPN